MKINQLTLTNFRGIENMSLTFTEKVTAIVGVNGVGKSSVLDALAIAMSSYSCRLLGQANKSRDIALSDIYVSADYSRVAVEVEFQDTQLAWAISKNRKAGKHEGERASSLEDLKQHTTRSHELLQQQVAAGQPLNFPLAVYYDVHRAVLDVPLRVKGVLQNTPAEAYSDALSHGGTDFRRFFAWFRQREDMENERIRDDSSFLDRDLEAVRTAIKQFTGFTDVRIRRKPTLRMTVKKQNLDFDVMQLSDGERCVLALVGDLARRLSLLNTASANPLTGEGIVLIDEIDLHLHPRWQRSVLANLVRTFPECQFIVSTHSPQVLGELRPESILLIKNGCYVGSPQRSLGLSSSEVLEEFMDADSRNANTSGQLANIRAALDGDELGEAERLINEFSVSIGEVPDLLEAKAALSILKWLPEEDA